MEQFWDKFEEIMVAATFIAPVLLFAVVYTCCLFMGHDNFKTKSD